jgi:serine/threonine protein kinase
VNHPGVVKVLGFALLPDDRPYLAMERLTGESLADRLRRGPMAAGEALARFAELADALGALHDRGLLHRDVKPENVFLAGEPARAMLFDFGIAKGEGAPASTMTQDGAVRGTPA